jgi:hypothetical protein
MGAGTESLRAALRSFASRATAIVVCAIFALVLLFIGLVFFAVSLDSWLAARTSAPLAALGTGAAAVLIALLMILFARISLSSVGRAREGGASRKEDLASALGEDLAKKVSQAIRSHGIAASVAALLAGILVGASPRLRRLLLIVLKI